MSAFLLSVISKDILQISIVIRWVVIVLFCYVSIFRQQFAYFFHTKRVRFSTIIPSPMKTTELTQSLPTRL